MRNMVSFSGFLPVRRAFTVNLQALLFASLQIFIVLMIQMLRKSSMDMEQILQRSAKCLFLTSNIVTNQVPDIQSTWYLPWGTPDPEGRNLFNDINPVTHANFRRKVAGAYTMSSLVSYEPFVDECTTVFMQRLSEFASSGMVFNMGHWFQCYAAESIGKITVSPKPCVSTGRY
jgi:hypothetical protein